LNVRSIKNKGILLNDFVVENKIDILALTETWLISAEPDNLIPINELTRSGYSFKLFAKDDWGGAVGIRFKQPLQLKVKPCVKIRTFELVDAY